MLLDNIQILATASLVGGIAFAFSGFMVGVRKNLDWMGILILSFLTAHGGGVMRDVLIGEPAAILKNALSFWLTGGVVFAAILLKLHKQNFIENALLFVICDAVGLVAFGISGALIGVKLDLHLFGVMALSFVTATGGGIMRDLLVNDVPLILYADFYGTITLLIGISVYFLHYLGFINPLSMSAVFIAALILRIIAFKKGWSLPKIG
jgi:uncharacterized membrane protein YeiH